MPKVMEIATPLGDDVLLFHGMQAREELSRLSELRLELLSARGDIDVDEILGKNVTVKVTLHDDSTRYFNGYVTRFSQGGKYGRYHRYFAEVRPWLWFLTRTADCRIFQEMTVPDILKLVFADHEMNDFALELTGTYRTWTYCVQYRETDFNFVSRLMEEEGIYYYIRHTDGHNTVVLTDASSGHTPAPGYEEVPFIPPEQLVRPEDEHVSRWQFSREIQPGVYVHDDFDMTRPGVELRTQKSRVRSHALAEYEVYDYPGTYAQRFDGEATADVRIDELASQFETADAETNARGVAVGSLMTLKGCPREDQNREHLIVSATYDLQYGDYEGIPEPIGATFRCRFVAMASQQQFRPRRLTRKPFVQGPQTAIVVGPSGEELYTDEFGRVKVQFHWDRYGQNNENSSCWIRVSHPWAGKGWGAVSTPRIGQEVIVDFLEGDPDQPIVTGRVYNGDNQPPFGFPAGAVVSGTKSQTHKGGGYNEVSLNDTAGQELITIHGQFDMDSTIEHDQRTTVHNNRTDTVDVDDSETVGNNQTWSVGVNRDATIGSNESLAVGANRTKQVGANEDVAIGANRSATVGGSETATVALQRTHTVGINETITVGAAQQVTVGGFQAVTVGALQAVTVGAAQRIKVGASQLTKVGSHQSISVGANQSTKIKSNQSTRVGDNQSVSVGGNAATKVKGNHGLEVKGGRSATVSKDDGIKVGNNFSLNAGDSITLKTGSASITMKKDGTITIKGKDITFTASGKLRGKGDGGVVMKGCDIKQN